MLYRTLLLGTLLSLLLLTAQAQTTASISGFVFDQNEAALPKARVTLSNTSDQRKQTVTTDANGAFRFDKLAAGAYEIKVEREGFKLATIPVSLGARPPAPLRIVLPVAELQQDVTVEAAAAQVNTDTGNNQDTVAVDRELLKRLPAFDQDVIGMAARFLDAGAIGTGGVTLIVDGMEVKKAGVTSSAIQEIKINSNPYSAEYARPGRGRIEVTTKPGTPQFHGEFNWTFRDARTNARDPFALTRAAEQRRMYEGNFTGPVSPFSKDKKHPFSFLLTAERDEQDQQAVIFARTPSGELRQNVPTPTHQTEFALRLTRQMSERTTASLHYSFEGRNSHNQGIGGFNLPAVATNSLFREDEVRVNFNTTLSPKLVHQLYLLVGHYNSPVVSQNQAPRVIVQEAFTSGGAQADFTRSESHGEWVETLSYQSGKHFIKTGVQIPDISWRGVFDRTNQLGTFYFASLADYQAQRPYNFIQQQGRTELHFLEAVVSGFVQDEFRVRPALNIAVGLRYDWQNYFHDHNNFAPRFGFAYAPGKARKTVVRGGAGIFYDRTGPQPISDFLRFDGQTLRRFVIPNPGFPNPLSNGQTLAAQPVSVVRLDPQVVIPHTLQYGIGVERQLQKGLTLAVNYVGTRGFDLFRSRDVNAPLAPPSTLRPNPNFSVTRQIEAAGRSNSHALEIALRGKVNKYFNGIVQYALGRARNDTGGVAWFPANSYDLRGEWGRADFDTRQRFVMTGTLKARAYFDLGVALTLNTGAPYSLTTGEDNNKDSFALDRPAGVGRNTLQGPGYAQLDLRWGREFGLVKGKKDDGPTLAVKVDAFNVFNRVNYAGFVGNQSSPFFGQAVAARPVRRMQFGVSLSF
ncbi:MAG: TonB-dependent receptor [Acidobacteria bacterium]|nr:TonB-dependent receptor [Acidobacteriota bacterium]MBI3425109.1 TonB-dependent receptor [Acidobacteriota bacterium]